MKNEYRSTFIASVVACLLAVTSSAASAQSEGESTDDPVPTAKIVNPIPRMKTVEVEDVSEPPPVPENNPEAARLRAYYLEKCTELSNAAEFSVGGQTARIAFEDDTDGYAVLAICLDKYYAGFPKTIGTISQALVVLSDTRFSALWPEAERKWGSDLSVFREHIRGDKARISARTNTYRSMVDSKTARALNKARELPSIGYSDQAREALQDRISWITAPEKKRERGRSYDLALLGVNYAGLIAVEDGSAPAADYLELFIRNTPIQQVDMVNLEINLAAYQAESGQYTEALETLEPAWNTFKAQNPRAGIHQISGSDREFSWILACAHHNLGNTAKAAPFIKTVESAEENVQDSLISRVKRSVLIKLRMYRCMDDPDGYFGVWEQRTPPVFDSIWLDFQRAGQAFRTTGIPRAWVNSDPRAEKITPHIRQLPERYHPALAEWLETPPQVGG